MCLWVVGVEIVEWVGIIAESIFEGLEEFGCWEQNGRNLESCCVYFVVEGALVV